MGEGLTFERLCQVAQLDEETGVQGLEEVLRSGWLCEDKHPEAPQVEADYIFPGEMIRAVVYQEAGAVRQRLIQRRVVAVLQEEAEHDQDEESCFPHPTPIDRHAPAENRERRERHLLTGAISKEMSSMHLISQPAVGEIGTIHWPLQLTRRCANTSIYRNTPLAAWERGAAVHAPFAFPRSPPDRTARGVLRRTEAEKFSTQALSTRSKGGKLG